MQHMAMTDHAGLKILLMQQPHLEAEPKTRNGPFCYDATWSIRIVASCLKHPATKKVGQCRLNVDRSHGFTQKYDFHRSRDVPMSKNTGLMPCAPVYAWTASFTPFSGGQPNAVVS